MKLMDCIPPSADLWPWTRGVEVTKAFMCQPPQTENHQSVQIKPEETRPELITERDFSSCHSYDTGNVITKMMINDF